MTTDASDEMETKGSWCLISFFFNFYWTGIHIACLYGVFLFVSNQVHSYPQVRKKVKAIYAVLRVLVLLLVIPATVSVLLPFLLYRIFVHFWLQFHHPNDAFLMDGADATWAIGHINPPIINCLFFLSGEPDIREIQRQALIKGLNLRCPDGSPRFPKLTRYIDEMLGYCVWRRDKKFDITDHIKVLDGLTEGTTLTEEEVMKQVTIMATKKFSPGKPAWEFLVIPSVEPISPRTNAEKTYAIFVRSHHSVCDGASLLRFFLTIVNDRPLPDDLLVPPQKQPLSCSDQTLLYLRAFSLLPLTLYHHFGRNDRNSLHGPYVSGEKIVAWSEPIELETIRSIENRLGGSMKDILCSSAAAALNTYFRRNGPVPQTIIALMNVAHRPPVNIQLVNAFSLLYFTLPTASMDPLERLQECRALNRRMVQSPEELTNYWMLRLGATVIPAPVFYYFVESSPSTIAFSSMPELEGKITFCGNEATEAMYWLPQRGTTGLCLSLISFNGRVRIGATADRIVIPHRHQVEEMLHHLVDHVKKLDLLADESE